MAMLSAYSYGSLTGQSAPFALALNNWRIDMDDQVIADISALLNRCRNEKRWPGPRKEIEEIEARYSDVIAEWHQRRMLANGWTREGNGWSKAV